MEDIIIIKGYGANRQESEVHYRFTGGITDSIGAIQQALEWADREWAFEYDEEHNRIPESLFKVFERITSVKIV